MEYVMKNWLENSSDLDYTSNSPFSSIYIIVESGEVILTIGGMTFPIQAGIIFDESFLHPKHIEIDATSGNGTWRGYIRGIR